MHRVISILLLALFLAPAAHSSSCGTDPNTSAPAGMPTIGAPAPAFVAHSTDETINFPADYAGRWVIFFSHPADFTPVCSTEFMTFQSMIDEFDALNCDLLGLSIDSVFAHLAWIERIEEKIEYQGMKNVKITFPIVTDLTMEVSKKYGMLQPTASNTEAVRGVFLIDPNGIIRAMLYYPLSNGRNIEEIKRLLIALQQSDAGDIATPANWMPGEPVIVPPPTGSCGIDEPREGSECLDWFFCFLDWPMTDGMYGIEWPQEALGTSN